MVARLQVASDANSRETIRRFSHLGPEAFFMKPLRFEAAARVWKDREALSPINRLLREGLGGGTRAQFKGHLQLVNTEQVSAA